MAKEKSPPSAADMQTAAAIYERHKGMMLKTASEHLADVTLAEDIVHDAVLRMAANADTLRSLDDRAQARYAKLTVRSAAADLARRTRGEQPLPEGEEAEALPGPGPEAELIERDTLSRRLTLLERAMDELPAADRELLVGRYLLGLGDEELARRLRIKPRSVAMKLTRLRRALRRSIEREEGGHD